MGKITLSVTRKPRNKETKFLLDQFYRNKMSSLSKERGQYDTLVNSKIKIKPLMNINAEMKRFDDVMRKRDREFFSDELESKIEKSFEREKAIAKIHNPKLAEPLYKRAGKNLSKKTAKNDHLEDPLFWLIFGLV